MNEPVISPSESQTENRLPDCVLMKLSATPVETTPQEQVLVLSSASSQLPVTKKHHLYLTIRFGEHREKIRGGYVTFGLKRGVLKVLLSNGKIPLETIELANEFEVAVEVQNIQGKTTEKHGSASLAVTGGVSTGAKEAETATEMVKQKVYQVILQGTEEAPIWIFKAQNKEFFLTGLLKQTKLGTLENTNSGCIKATFEASIKDIVLVTGEGLYPKDISRNKRAIIEQMIAIKLLKDKLNSCLSQVELCHD